MLVRSSWRRQFALFKPNYGANDEIGFESATWAAHLERAPSGPREEGQLGRLRAELANQQLARRAFRGLEE